MDLYVILKLVHIAGAIFWVGGATLMTVLALIIMARGDDRESLTLMRHFGLAGNRVFLPVSLFVILTGLVMAWLGGWGFAAWTVLAFATVVCTATLGGAVLGPSLERAIKLDDAGQPAEAMALGRWVVRLVKLDLGAQWAIIAMMVLKPGWTDLPLLAVPASLMALGALLFVLPAQARPAPRAV
jgi:uncharacterized membrane protein